MTKVFINFVRVHNYAKFFRQILTRLPESHTMFLDMENLSVSTLITTLSLCVECDTVCSEHYIYLLYGKHHFR
jgi:hypothetical protein